MPFGQIHFFWRKICRSANFIVFIIILAVRLCQYLLILKKYIYFNIKTSKKYHYFNTRLYSIKATAFAKAIPTFLCSFMFVNPFIICTQAFKLSTLSTCRNVSSTSAQHIIYYLKQFTKCIQVIDGWHTKSLQPMIDAMDTAKSQVLLNIFHRHSSFIHDSSQMDSGSFLINCWKHFSFSSVPQKTCCTTSIIP